MSTFRYWGLKTSKHVRRRLPEDGMRGIERRSLPAPCHRPTVVSGSGSFSLVGIFRT
jgi:hypothetical protein